MKRKVSKLQWAMVQLMRLREHPARAFICAPAGERSHERYLAHVFHDLPKKAEMDDLVWLRGTLGKNARSFFYLYAMHDGGWLFQQRISRLKKGNNRRDGGFHFLSIDEMRKRNGEHNEIASVELSPRETLLPFAEVPLSANLICIKTTRRLFSRRHVLFEVNHDCPPGGFGIPQSLENLILLLSADPAFFLYTNGCYTRYADGHTDTQWIPIRYLPDGREITDREVAEEPYPDYW